MKNNNILEKIFSHKSEEVAERKKVQPINMLENKSSYARETLSLSRAIRNQDNAGVIAEFKTRSPSMGMINENAELKQITQGYLTAGASALSILTDENFFGGSPENLEIARKNNDSPILQKDFIMDPYQILEAKAYGADAILLIAAMLPKAKVRELSSFAVSLGMEILLEIHQEEELDRVNDLIHLVGVNNRNLKNFIVNQENSMELVNAIPDKFVKIAESGIESSRQAYNLLNNGFDGLLIGGEFMKHPKPEEACRDFIDQLKIYKQKDDKLK
ncbi:MAG: indole-3-glycerol phosphate synthase TrpC [Bacteroidota bacterium]